jgi:hypothetical protein
MTVAVYLNDPESEWESPKMAGELKVTVDSIDQVQVHVNRTFYAIVQGRLNAGKYKNI